MATYGKSFYGTAYYGNDQIASPVTAAISLAAPPPPVPIVRTASPITVALRPAFSLTPAAVLAKTSVVVQLVGLGTTWTNSTPFTATPQSGASFTAGAFSFQNARLVLWSALIGITPGSILISDGTLSATLVVTSVVTRRIASPVTAALRGGLASRMLKWLPEMWYGQSLLTAALFGAEEAGLNQLTDDINRVRNARLPQHAEDWGVQRLEDETGIGERPDLDLQDRQTRLLAHFRGIGTTIARLRTIAKTWGFGDVTITPDPEAFILYVEFVNQNSLPADLASHNAELRDDVEAHLGITYTFAFETWGNLALSGTSWQNIVNHGITWQQLTTWVPGVTERTATPVTVALVVHTRVAMPVTAALA